MAAGDLFKKAARYRKSHPGMTMPEAVQACSKKHAGPKKKKAAAVGRRHKARKARAPRKAAKKRSAPAKAGSRKVKMKIKPGKKGNFTMSISGVSQAKIQTELAHKHGLEQALEKHLAMLKTKGLKASEKNQIRRDVKHYRNAINASKKHISSLRRSI